MAVVSAQDVCHQLLYELRMSNLHFALSEKPHSVQIVIRKRFLNDKQGPAKPTPQPSFHEQVNLLETENSDLKVRIEELEVVNKSSKDTANILEQKITKIEAAALKSFEERKLETATMKNALKNAKSELECASKDVKNKSKALKEIEKEHYKLEQKNENLAENNRKLKSEVSSSKTEIKKLEKQQKTKLKKSHTVSTSTVSDSSELSASSITTPHISGMASYLPDMSELSVTCIQAHTPDELNNILTIEPEEPPLSVSSAASCSPSTPARWTPSSNQSEVCANPNYSGVCSHSPQCISRQPRPPPPEKCSILKHLGSKYHVHMVNETSGVPARYGPHEYCMRIEYENYGCEDCIWFKWWGELHGYPDISPWSYREHLASE